MRISTGVLDLISGNSLETKFGEGYYYMTPRISSRGERFAWANDTVLYSWGNCGWVRVVGSRHGIGSFK